MKISIIIPTLLRNVDFFMSCFYFFNNAPLTLKTNLDKF